MQKRAKSTVLALGLGGALAAGIAGPAAYAATSDHPRSAPSTTAAAAPGTGGAHRHGPGPRGAFGPTFAQDLATQLGVSKDKVTTALKQLRAEHRAEHRADHRNAPQGSPSGGPAGGRPGNGQPPTAAERARILDTFASDLAGKLGMDSQKVKAAVEAVMAKEKADHQAAVKSRLDAAVKQGRISQADEDAYLRVVKAGVVGPGSK